MDLYNIVLYSLILVIVANTAKSMKRHSKNKKYIKVMQSYNDKDLFFDNINKFIEGQKDPEFIAKGYILKLYGLVYHDVYEEFDEVLEKIDFKKLFTNNKGQVDYKKLDLNEDSYFYYCFYTHFLTYEKNRVDLREKLKEKIKVDNELLKDHLIYNIYLNSFDVFETNDRNSYFEANYGGISGRYCKQLIQLYRVVSDSLFYLSLKKSNAEFDEIEYLKNELKDFSTKSYGERLMKSLGIYDEFKEVE